MSLQTFLTNFYDEYNEITHSLNSLSKEEYKSVLEQEARLKLSARYEEISLKTENLQKVFTENSASIPLYEVRKAQEHLAKLSKLSQDKRDELFPKKKFGFKSKQNMTTLENAIETAQPHNTTTTSVPDNIDSKKKKVDIECSCTIKNLSDEKFYVKKEAEINGNDVALINIKNSVIQLQGNPSVVHVSNIESSTILIGPITGPAFLNNIKNSKIIVACHQLRIHETHNTEFYINVVSRAIIENCNQVYFAPYSWSYPNIEDHIKMSSISFTNVNWTSIDDFNWLSQDKQSPNWSLLEESKRFKWQTNENDQVSNL
jgi:hypothetical protein